LRNRHDQRSTLVRGALQQAQLGARGIGAARAKYWVNKKATFVHSRTSVLEIKLQKLL